MKVAWFAGWNQPGCLPDDRPAEFASWRDAHTYLRREVADLYMEQAMERGITSADHAKASRLIDTAEADQPVSVYFNGLVWWIADLPTDSGSEEPG